MKRVRAAVALAAIALMTAGVSAEPYFIRCDIDRTLDAKTSETTRTTGTDTFQVTPGPDGTATYALPYPCAPGTTEVRVSKTEIWARCLQLMADLTFERIMIINRMSGEYLSMFSVEGERGLVHMGRCQRAEPLF